MKTKKCNNCAYLKPLDLTKIFIENKEQLENIQSVGLCTIYYEIMHKSMGCSSTLDLDLLKSIKPIKPIEKINPINNQLNLF